MRNIRLSVQQVAVLGVLALVVGAMVWWQTAVAPTDNPSTPVSSDVITGTENQNPKQTTIQFAISDGEQLFYEPLVKSFEAENPDIQIRLVSIGEIRAAAGETPASVALAEAADVFPSRFTNFGPSRASVTHDLTPFIQADPTFNAGDFYIDTLQEMDGSVRMLPISIDIQLIYFDRNAFDAVGLAYPQPGWTWSQFQEVANALTIRDGDETSQWGFVEPHMRYFIEGQLNNPLVTTGAVRFTDTDVATAVHWYTNLFLIDRVAPLPASDDVQMRLTSIPYFASEEAQQLIGSGSAAMWSDSANTLGLVAEGRNVGVVPYPVTTPVTNSSPIHADGLVISAGTSQPEAAWRWMDYLSRQAPADFGSNALLPARVSVATASGFWNNIDPPLTDALRFALEHQRPFPRHPAFDTFNQAINAILINNQSVETALAEAQAANLSGEDSTSVLVEPVAPPSSENEDGIVTIRFLPFTLGGDGSLEPFRLLANQFETQNPGIRIALLEGNLAANAIGQDFVFTAQNTECFQMLSTRYSLSVAEQTAVIPLDPFLDAEPAFLLTDIPQPLVNAYKLQGEVVGIPFELYPFFIAYNKDLFDAAGVSYPTPDWTTDDFLATAVALTTGDGNTKQFGFIPHPYESQTLAIMLAQLNAVVIDTQVQPPTVNLTDSRTAKALRWYVDLGREFGAKPSYPLDVSELDHAALNELFQARRTLIESGGGAMWIFSGLDVFTNPDTGQLNVGTVPLPTSPDTGEPSSSSLPLNHVGSFISAAASQQQANACWQWLKFLSTSANVGQGIPARLSVVESTAFRQRVGDEMVISYLALLENMNVSNAPANLNADQAWLSASYYWLNKAYKQINTNERSIEDALVAAQQTFDAYRSCIIEENGYTDTEVQDQCAAAVSTE